MKRAIFALLTATCWLGGAFAQKNSDSLEQIREAVTLMDNGSIGTAISILNNVLEQEPDNYTALYELGYAHYINENYVKAVEVFNKAISHKECNDQTFAMLGNSYDMAGYREKAIEVYKIGAEKFPNSAYMQNELGTMALKQHNYEEALEYYLKGILADPTFAPCYYRAALILLNNANDPTWGFVYGEMYLAMERYNADRIDDISNLLNDAYRRILKVENDTDRTFFPERHISLSKEDADNPDKLLEAFNRFDITYALCLEMAAKVVNAKTPDAESICQIRKAFTDIILQKDYKEENPFILHLKAVRASGVENAYHHYIVLGLGSKELNDWMQTHPVEWNNFADWIDGYTPYLGNGTY